MPILSIENLSVRTRKFKPASLLEDISFVLNPGETLAVIGESGAGKSTICRAILGILPKSLDIRGCMKYNHSEIEISIGNWDDDRQFTPLRGSEIALIFQDAAGSMNPLRKCGNQIRDIMKTADNHTSITKQSILDFLSQTGFREPDTIYRSYPHQLSGGMAQHVALALALAGQPKILIADEPTSSLDAISKQKYLDRLAIMKKKYDLSLIFITHNLNDALSLSDSILVLYRGRAVEFRKTADLKTSPKHPYTGDLLNLLRSVNQSRMPDEMAENFPVGGNHDSGCPYCQKCSRATALCGKTFPPKTIIKQPYYFCCNYPLEKK